MKLIADQKRRVVLPRPAKEGDVFEVVQSGDRFILVKMVQSTDVRPPVSPNPLDPAMLKGIDLDAPAYAPLTDESPA